MLSALKSLSPSDVVAALNELLAAVRRDEKKEGEKRLVFSFSSSLPFLTSMPPPPKKKQHALGAHRAADGREVFKATPPGDGARFKGLSAEEVLVYQAVEASGNVGIWTKELRARTNLQQPAVARMLKALETRGLVKSVRSVANGSRKVYMLRGLEPAREVTGGAWYTGHEFDSAFTVRSLLKTFFFSLSRDLHLTFLVFPLQKKTPPTRSRSLAPPRPSSAGPGPPEGPPPPRSPASSPPRASPASP